MPTSLEHLQDSISGIWGSKKYELVLGLNNVFTFEEKETEEIKDGFYSIIQIANNHYPTLRLTELSGIIHDYTIIDVIIFHTLIISNDSEEIHFRNVPPDEYDGEIFNPADN